MIEALIAAGATLLVCLVNNIFNQHRFEEQLKQSREEATKRHQETISLISYRLEQLEKKVEIHNNAVDRLYKVERQLGIDEEKIKTNADKIENLEQYHK